MTKCREYGGDIATPANQAQSQIIFDLIENMFNERYSFSNPKYCAGGEANKCSMNCPFCSEGLSKINWGQMIMWLGYHYDNDDMTWEMADGTHMNLLEHYWGFSGASGKVDQVHVNDEGEIIITIDNSHSPGGDDFD